jgi:MFS family permease
MSDHLVPVDHSALKVNQGAIILLLLAAFIVDLPVIVAAVAAVMLLGSVFSRPGFGFLYNRLLKPLGWVKPEVLHDNREPHVFAQGFGGVVLIASAALLLSGVLTAGWAFTWLVIALAALNLFVGFCVGCAMYYWFNRLQLPGFKKSPPGDIPAGMRPKAR